MPPRDNNRLRPGLNDQILDRRSTYCFPYLHAYKASTVEVSCPCQWALDPDRGRLAGLQAALKTGHGPGCGTTSRAHAPALPRHQGPRTISPTPLDIGFSPNQCPRKLGAYVLVFPLTTRLQGLEDRGVLLVFREAGVSPSAHLSRRPSAADRAARRLVRHPGARYLREVMDGTPVIRLERERKIITDNYQPLSGALNLAGDGCRRRSSVVKHSVTSTRRWRAVRTTLVRICWGLCPAGRAIPTTDLAIHDGRPGQYKARRGKIPAVCDRGAT